MNEQDYNAALDAWEAMLAQAYLQQASELVGDISLAQITAMIAAGDDLALVQSLEKMADYTPTLEAMRSAYLAGAQDEIGTLSGAAVSRIIQATGRRPIFDPRRQTAEAWMQAQAKDVVTALAQQQGDTIGLILTAGRDRGATPRQIAEAIVGPMQSNGKRSGGVIGLAGNDTQAIINARAQLSSGDPAKMREYFDRIRRDRRFDKTIQKAIQAGVAPPQDVIDKAVSRYSERLLQTRAEAQASIEAMEVYNAGRQQFYKQLIDDGIDATTITKQWKTRGDEKVREAHRRMNGQTQYGDVPFNAPGGYKMAAPGDMSQGAPVSLVVRCRCRAVYRIDPKTSE